MSEHWYTNTGKPCYEVAKKDGGMRSTTLADARKLGLVPSVTTVLDVIHKDALVTWKVNQGILAALTLSKRDDEAESAYISRILTDSRQQAKDAADEGSRIHDAIERSFKGLVVEDRYQPHVAGVRAELLRIFPHVNDWVAEQSFCHEYGFGGKVDLHSPSTGIVVDHKGKDGDFSDGKKLAYDQHWQLSPYQKGLCPNSRERCANIFFSRTHPGIVTSHVWSPDEMAEGWQVFMGALTLWKAIKKFDPSQMKQAD